MNRDIRLNIISTYHPKINHLIIQLTPIVSLFILIIASAIPAHSQESEPSNSNWSDNILLEEIDGHYPRLVSDRAGRLHAFWRSRVDENLNSPADDGEYVIMYRRLEDGLWTNKVDILTLPGLAAMKLGSVAIDDQDILNLLWTSASGKRDLYLSRAHSSIAENPWSWSTTVVESAQYSIDDPDLIVEPGGRVHLTYVLDNDSVVYKLSDDYGASWTEDTIIWGILDELKESVSGSRIAIDGKSILHVVWTENSSERNWLGVAIFYARSTDKGISWNVTEVHRSEPEESTAGWINVAVREENEIHLAWNRGDGDNAGRYHMWSADNGDNWSERQPIMPPVFSGQSQWPLMEVDSAEILHLITLASGQDQETRPRYTSWDGRSWSPMMTIPESSGNFDSWFTISLGNQLHLIHPSHRASGELLYNSVQVRSPRIQSMIISMPDLSSNEVEESQISDIEAIQTDENDQSIFAGLDLNDPPRPDSNVTSIIVPILAASLLIIAVIAGKWWTQKRR